MTIHIRIDIAWELIHCKKNIDGLKCSIKSDLAVHVPCTTKEPRFDSSLTNIYIFTPCTIYYNKWTAIFVPSHELHSSHSWVNEPSLSTISNLMRIAELKKRLTALLLKLLPKSHCIAWHATLVLASHEIPSHRSIDLSCPVCFTNIINLSTLLYCGCTTTTM
jgi:hypothetical protein